MDLLDVIDPNFGLVQDTYTGKRFGDGQLEIVGWSGKYRSVKLYILKCSVCSMDPEIFGEGYFKSRISNLNTGKMPCGCSPFYKTENQALVLVNRATVEMEYNFLGWAETYKGANTSCILSCEIHGEWRTNINRILNAPHGCKECSYALVGERFLKSDSDLIEGFLKTGSYHPDTIFIRSEDTNKNGHKTFWQVSCPVCLTTVRSERTNLMAGKVPCLCSPTGKQNEAYINIISDAGTDIALKFGIATTSVSRLKQLQNTSIYDIRQFGVWKFLSREVCRKAESTLKKSLICSVLPREEMLDGYTETTHLYNLEKIINTYESFGGVRMNE